MTDSNPMDSASLPEPATIELAQAEPLKASFKGVVLLCGDCEERSSGPKKLRVKDLRKSMKDAVRPAKGHLRVAITGCLGPCPRKAMTVAVVAGGVVSLRAVRRSSEVAAIGVEAVGLLGES
ncbi:MAG: hypothetical protein JWQ11_4174 [Rhizobacter sp.]|nr:hypothetical protein [Rhizobacter sp.]